jgi:hypothetical protein
MKRTNFLILPALMLFSFTGIYCGETSENPESLNSDPTSLQSSSEVITREIDATQHFRPFPELTAYWNTSLQKATTPVIAEVAAKAYGKANITRCWLNLDEMWDYRTREFNFNFQIGVDKYKDLADKYRESWNWEVESPVHFYDYMKTFSDNSNEILLNIRRYERDIMDGKLPVSADDYKMIIKTGLKHYKILYPNIRYVQIGNEYNGGSFMKATEDEYYPFFKLGYEAINEVNEEMGLEGDDRILVGMSPPAGKTLERLGRLFNLYKNDLSRTKRMDFVSWHEYGVPIPSTANREKEIKALLRENEIPENIPFFITEHEPFHGSYQDQQLEHHMMNTSHLPKSLYFTSLYSPQINIFPWVLYHNSKIQTKFMWFDGPNEPDTKAFEIRMLPLGASMKMLDMHKGREIKVDNSIESNDLVIASVQKDKILVEAINYDEPKDVKLSLTNICKVFPELKNGKIKVVKYLIDSSHSNCLTKPEYAGGLEKVDEYVIDVNDKPNVFEHKGLEKYGLVLWEVIKN